MNPLTSPLTVQQQDKLAILIGQNSQTILEAAFRALKNVGVDGISPEQVALLGDGRFVINMQMNFARQLPERALWNALTSTEDPTVVQASFKFIEDEIQDMVKRMPASLRKAADAYEQAINKAEADNESNLYVLR